MSQIKIFLYTLCTLSGAIIGVGIFSLPYITLKAGFLAMVGYFVVLGGIVILIHLCYGELVLKTPDRKRLPGFARLYLGKWGWRLAFTSIILAVLGSNLAYLIVGGQFLQNLFSPVFGGSNLAYTLIYFSLGAILIFFGAKFISKFEFWGVVLFFVILIVIFIKEIPLLRVENLFIKTVDFKYLFLPYGAILFALWGADVIPEAEELLGKKKRFLRVIIPLAIIVAIIVYVLFIYLILSISGPQTTESALTGLRPYVGDKILALGFLFGFLTTFTSFIAFGLTLTNTLCYDFKIPRAISWAITCFIPLVIFLAGFTDFIKVISFVGGVTMGFNGILILLMYQKIKERKISFLIFPLILILITGIIYEVIYFLK